MSKRKICIVTTSRADYGLIYWTMKAIQDDPALTLQVIAAGMHIEPYFGSTWKIIEKDGFPVSAKIDMNMTDDSEGGIARSIGAGFERFAEAYRELEPDIVVLLGDRYELIPAAVSAMICHIPIAHIHGGESSQGAMDEAIRHAITKMASVHFVATEEYRKRVIQLGEHPATVHNFGATWADSLYNIDLLDKESLQDNLQFDLSGTVAVATYHPETLIDFPVREQILRMLEAVRKFDFKIVFTKANADTNGRIINEEIQKFCDIAPERYVLFENLGLVRYLSCLKHFGLMIGNSSSGILESASFKIPVVNIGDREKGRLRAANVIDTGFEVKSIRNAINKALSGQFRQSLKDLKNPYDKFGDGKTGFRIKETLKNLKITPELFKKKFYDLDFTV